MLNFASLKVKLIIAGILLAIMGAGGFYIWHLNSKVDSLKIENTQLHGAVNAAQDTIKENDRRVDVVDQVNSLGDKQRVIIQKEYHEKLIKIDNSIKEGKDKPVGLLLEEFFNE